MLVFVHDKEVTWLTALLRVSVVTIIIIIVIYDALFVMEDDGARVMNSQFSRLRIEQSAEGYSGVRRPLALFRRAN